MAVKQSPITLIVLTVAFVLTGVAWMLLPTLQSGNRKASQAAAEQIERARRLVNDYESAVVRRSLIQERLRTSGVSMEKADWAAITEKGGKKLEKQFADRWSNFPPMDWESDPPAPAEVDGGMADLMASGVREVEGGDKQNEKLLSDALALVDGATSGPGGSGSAEAHRLKGIIRYYQGSARAWDARNKRAEADVQRRALAGIAAEMSGLAALKENVTGGAADEHIQKSETAVNESQAQLQKVRTQLIDLDGKIQKLEAQLTESETKAAAALKSLDALRLAGINYADPQGAAEYERRLMEVDAAYRAASREVQSLRFGRYAQATLSPPGEYLSGRYVVASGSGNPGLESGLATLRAQRDGLAATLRVWESALGNLQGNLFQQKGLKDSMEARRQAAETQLAALSKEAVNTYDEMSRFDAEAETAEDAALDMFNQSARAAKAAADAYRQSLNEARTLSEALAPEAKERSAYNAAAQDGQMIGHLSGQIVDAKLARARVLQSRFAARQQNSELLLAMQPVLALKEADGAREKKRADEARAEGIGEINEAAGILETAHREAGRHWTFVAQSGNLADLLALYGEAASAKDALEMYRSAIKGRETQPFARQFSSRISRLENATK